MEFVVSDLLFQHENIIRFDGRPFVNKEEMDTMLIQNWNSVVHQQDTVYVLGDMFYKIGYEKAESILKRLNGIKVYIFGNHEKLLRQDVRIQKEYFKSVHDYLEVPYTYKNEKHKLVMSHYPIPMFDGHFKSNVTHFYGHVHKTREQALAVYSQYMNFENRNVKSTHKMLNVGVMLPYMGYEPKPINYLIKTAEEKSNLLHDFYNKRGLVPFKEFEKEVHLFL